MNVRLIFSCAVTICALSVFAGLANEESRNIPESTSTRIVTDYAKAWIAGDIEKMYASFPPGRFSFAEFKKSLSSFTSDKNRPIELVTVGKPYLVSTLSMWAVNYTLRFKNNGKPIDKYYRALIAEKKGDYFLRNNTPYFSETDLNSIKTLVESFLAEWKKGEIENLNQMFVGNPESSHAEMVIISLYQRIAKTERIAPITQYQFNEPIEWSPVDKACVYAEVSIPHAEHEINATLKFVLSQQQGIASNWKINVIVTSAPFQIRNAILETVNLYLQAWMEGDPERMYDNYYGLKGKAQDVFGPVTKVTEMPLEVPLMDQPDFLSLDTAIVNYSCIFKNLEKEGVLKARQAKVKDINGKWLIITDYGVISSADKLKATLLIQGYVKNWIAKDAKGIYKYFKPNTVTLPELESKMKNDAEKDQIPQKLTRFLNLWSDNQDTINLGFEVANKSGSTSNYQAKLSRISGLDWAILSITEYPDQQTTELLNKKTTAYVEAWIKGDVHSMFKCFEELGDELTIKESDFINTIKSSLESENKPLRIISLNRPFYAFNDFIKVPYTVELKVGRQELYAVFKFSEEKHSWLFIGSGKKKD